MAKVITFSEKFPAYHPRKGEATNFVKKVHKALITHGGMIPGEGISFSDIDKCRGYDPKIHTIRAGNRWKAGDKASLRIWSGRPYFSKQIEIAPEIVIPRVVDFRRDNAGYFYINNNVVWQQSTARELAQNDGLTTPDLEHWFNKPFSGQIIFFVDKQTSY